MSLLVPIGCASEGILFAPGCLSGGEPVAEGVGTFAGASQAILPPFTARRRQRQSVVGSGFSRSGGHFGDDVVTGEFWNSGERRDEGQEPEEVTPDLTSVARRHRVATMQAMQWQVAGGKWGEKCKSEIRNTSRKHIGAGSVARGALDAFLQMALGGIGWQQSLGLEGDVKCEMSSCGTDCRGRRGGVA